MDIVCKGVWLKPSSQCSKISSVTQRMEEPLKGKIKTRRNKPDRLREVLGMLDRRRLLLSQLSPTLHMSVTQIIRNAVKPSTITVLRAY